MFNVIESNPTPKQLASLCRVCNKGGLSRAEAEHRVHEYCRSVIGSAWKLPTKATR
ncbi:hypothetical protein [Micromonospora sp. NPDC048169]|uniref:hypothetical protein n=1 Tax=Micromonospora sp. NPDC048169 TaxID=3154711 RepID=UPI0034037707